MSEVDHRAEWYWVRRDALGRLTAALVEAPFTVQPDSLLDELRDMASVGPIERIFVSRVVIGECLKELLVRK